jgi:hypothetical protein
LQPDAVAVFNELFQNDDHHQIHKLGQNIQMETIPQKIMAAQLLGAYNTQRNGIRKNCGIHTEQPCFVGQKIGIVSAD